MKFTLHRLRFNALWDCKKTASWTVLMLLCLTTVKATDDIKNVALLIDKNLTMSKLYACDVQIVSIRV